jgi:hypothetical protein
MEGEYFYLDGCFATSSSQLPYSKPFKNICCADVFAFLLLFALLKASFQRLLAIKKPALFVRAL